MEDQDYKAVNVIYFPLPAEALCLSDQKILI